MKLLFFIYLFGITYYKLVQLVLLYNIRSRSNFTHFYKPNKYKQNMGGYLTQKMRQKEEKKSEKVEHKRDVSGSVFSNLNLILQSQGEGDSFHYRFHR